MATKKQDILALLDKVIGKKGSLRIPAYWMREVLLKIMEWAESLTPKIYVPTKMSELENDISLATQSYVNAKVTEAENQTTQLVSDKIGFLDYSISPAFGDIYFSTYSAKHKHIIISDTTIGQVKISKYYPSNLAQIARVTYYFTGASSISLPTETIWENGVIPTLDASQHYELTITQIRYANTNFYKASLR